MKKLLKWLKRIFIVIIVCFVVVWSASILKCEVLTFQHWKEFEGLEESTNMIGNSETVKVLDYSDLSARVYYKNREGGDILTFEKQDGEWVYNKWETIWSRTGSADDFLWPYIR